MVPDLLKLDRKVHRLIHHQIGRNRNNKHMHHHSRRMRHRSRRMLRHSKHMLRHNKHMLHNSRHMLHRSHKIIRRQHPILITTILDRTPYQDRLANLLQVSLKLQLMHTTNILSLYQHSKLFDYVRRQFISFIGLDNIQNLIFNFAFKIFHEVFLLSFRLFPFVFFFLFFSVFIFQHHSHSLLYVITTCLQSFRKTRRILNSFLL